MNWDDLDDRLIVRKDIKTIFYEPEIQNIKLKYNDESNKLLDSIFIIERLLINKIKG